MELVPELEQKLASEVVLKIVPEVVPEIVSESEQELESNITHNFDDELDDDFSPNLQSESSSESEKGYNSEIDRICKLVDNIGYQNNIKPLEISCPFNFAFENIEIKGTVTDPLFNLWHIANKVNGDGHKCSRFAKKNEDFAYFLPGKNIKGKNKKLVPFVTEKGVYKYLMSLNNDKAKKFQDAIYDALVEYRKQFINLLIQENKIMYEKLIHCKEMKTNLIFSSFVENRDLTVDDLFKYCVTKYFSVTNDFQDPEFTIANIDEKYIKKMYNIAYNSFNGIRNKYGRMLNFEECEREIRNIIYCVHRNYSKATGYTRKRLDKNYESSDDEKYIISSDDSNGSDEERIINSKKSYDHNRYTSSDEI